MRFDKNPHSYGSPEYHRHERDWEREDTRKHNRNWEIDNQNQSGNNNNEGGGGGLLGLAVGVVLALFGLGGD